ncbi:MAG: phosphotransferase [Pseudomonadota bacterium]
MTSDARFDAFLAGTPWAKALREPLPADASTRRYIRLFDTQRGETALLMDAPPETESKTGAFVEIAQWLGTAGFSAPEIFKADLSQGLVLLEDFGQGSFAHVLETSPEQEAALYDLAGQTIAALTQHTPPDVPPYDHAELTRELDLFCDYWWPDTLGSAMPAAVRHDFYAAWEAPLALLAKAVAHRPAITLRDFHKDNLFFLPAREGIAQVGLIDFQDALVGHAAYDLVSLLQDVRRDIPEALQERVFGDVSNALHDPLLRDAYAAFGAQRALKILGIFVRLDTVYGKPAYRMHLPRTWARLQQNLSVPLLEPLKHWLETHGPEQRSTGQ